MARHSSSNRIMDLKEAKSLMPAYLNGTLSPEERQAMEHLLRDSKVLQEELVFWRKAREAVRMDGPHLSPEQIVDYAERTITDSLMKTTVESHLQSCSECREEYDIALETLYTRSVPSITPTPFEGIRRFFLSLKLAYIVPVGAMLIAAIAVWQFAPREEEEPKVGDRDKVEHSARLVLPFRNIVRSGEEIAVPTVRLADSVSTLHLLVCIQADSIRGTRYTAQITDPAGSTISLLDTASKSARVSGPVDTLTFGITRELISNKSGEYTLSVFEVPSSLPPGFDAFPLEPYPFRVERQD